MYTDRWLLRLLFCLVLAPVIGIFGTVRAQPLPDNKSLHWQKDLVHRYSQLWKRTLQLAKQHNWPLRKNYSNQRVLQLQSTDASGQPVYYALHNIEAARGTRTLALQGGGTLPVNLSGNLPDMAGKLGLWDGGRVLESHQEFGGVLGQPRVQQKDNGIIISNHSTHLAGTLIGKGVEKQARGMAYEARLSVWDYTNDVAELAVAAPGLLVSNHAYGPIAGWVYNASRPGTKPDLKWEWWGNTAVSATDDYTFGLYNTTVQDLDRLAYNNPYFLMVRSADNKRAETGPPAGIPYFLKSSEVKSTLPRNRNAEYDVIPADATAKNVLTVGAADINYTSDGYPVLLGTTGYSGWGPTDDGRIKPDLLGIGTNVLSAIAADATSYGTNTGTSMASANVSGSLFLLQELYARQRGVGMPQTGQFMRAATLKGLVLHTADRSNPAAGPDYRQGWGLLNTEAAARLLLNENKAHLILEQNLVAGKTSTRTFVAQGNEPLVVTLSWTDPEGGATNAGIGALNNRTPKLINDLDLRLSDGERTILPFALDPASPARSAVQQDNFRDNVEQIYLPDPVPGKTYTITISHKGSMKYAGQPFSVVVSGLKRAACHLSASILPAGDTVICEGATLTLRSSIGLAGLQYQWLRDGVIDTLATAPSYEVFRPGTYLLRVKDINGCSTTSQPVHVKTVTLALSLTGSQWVCNADKPVQLKASLNAPPVSGATFSWLLNNKVISQSNDSTLSVTQPGRYQVRVANKNCQLLSAEKTVLAASVNDLDLSPTGTELRLPQGATLTLRAPQDTSFLYQWYWNENAVLNASAYKLSVTKAGTYKVRVTQHECIGWSTERTVVGAVVTASATTDPAGYLKIYPNPAETSLLVRYTNPLKQGITIRVIDGLGRLWQVPVSLRYEQGETRGDVTIQHLPPGLYMLHLSSGDIIQTERFLKK